MSLIAYDPLIISKLAVKRPLLVGSQLEGEPGPHLLQPHLLRALEVVLVVPEEDVVPLVVEGGHSLPGELRLVVEERGKHPGDAVAEPRAEVVEDHLGPVLCDLLPILPQIFRDLDITQFEVSGWALG